MPMEIICHNEELFNEAIEKMSVNNPEYVDVLFEYPNAIDALSIAAMLRGNKTINRLELSHGDYLRDFGAEYIAEALKSNTQISDLILRADEIGDEGVVKLSKALKINKTIASIDLSDNRIGDIGAEAIIAALEINKTIIHVDLSRGNNNVGEENIARINALTERNKRIFHEAVYAFSRGEQLSSQQRNLIMAHLKSKRHEAFIGISEQVRTKLFEQFRDNIDTLEKKARDPGSLISAFIDYPKEVLAFNKAVIEYGVKGRKIKNSVDGYFRALIHEITPVIENQFAHMKEVSGDFREAISSKNNIVFIADAINYGMSFAKITHHLEKILADPKAKEFVLENPKKLGYLITLEEGKFNKAMGILNHPKLGEFVKRSPEEISTLTRVSDDPEKLLRAVHAIKEDPNISSVKAIVRSSAGRYAKAVRASKSAERRIR